MLATPASVAGAALTLASSATSAAADNWRRLDELLESGALQAAAMPAAWEALRYLRQPQSWPFGPVRSDPLRAPGFARASSGSLRRAGRPSCRSYSARRTVALRAVTSPLWGCWTVGGCDPVCAEGHAELRGACGRRLFPRRARGSRLRRGRDQQDGRKSCVRGEVAAACESLGIDLDATLPSRRRWKARGLGSL